MAIYVPVGTDKQEVIKQKRETGNAVIPVTLIKEVAVQYPYEVVNEYGGATVTPVPPDSVARIPNCSIAVVEEAADAPIALMVFEAFC